MSMSAIYSCDDHLDLSAVPPTVWESRLTRAQEAHGPRVVDGEKGRQWVCEDQLGSTLDDAPSVPPSALVRRQVILTFEQEPLAEQFVP